MTVVPSPSTSWLRARRALLVEIVLVLAGSTLLAVLITWPLASDIRGLMPGLPGGDQLGYLFDFWYLANHSLPIFVDHVQTLVGAPFGRVIPAAPNLTLAATLIPAAFLTKMFGGVVAYNLLVIGGLALTGASMYLLVRWLGLGIGPAAWAGLAYMVLPYHLLAVQAWVTLVAYQCFPLLLMGLIAWVRKPTLRNGIGTTLALLLTSITFPYFAAMGLIMLAVAVITSYVIQGRRAGWVLSLRAPALLIAAVVAAILAPLAAVSLGNRSGTATQARSLQEVADLGPFISDYWTPPRTSAFMNGFTDPNTWYGIGSVGGERLMYMGAGVVILLVVGIVLGYLWRRKLTTTWRALIIVGPPMAVVLILASLRTPYPIAGADVPMPSRAIFEFVPYIRAFGRFIIAIAVIAIAIGALGLRLLMNRFADSGRRVVLASALVLTGFEAAVGLPVITAPAGVLPHGNTVDSMPTWKWLAAHPDGGIVFEQPGVGNTSLERIWMYGVSRHGHPVLNVIGNPGEESGNFIPQVNGPPGPASATLLATAGVKYVTINPWAYEDLKMTTPSSVPDGYRQVAEFPNGSAVWQLTATPADGFATFQPGVDFPRSEMRDGKWINLRWMFERAAVKAWVEEPGTYRARFLAAPAGGAQRLIATSPDGFTQSVVISSEREVSLPVHIGQPGDTIRLRAEPARGPGRPTIQMTPWLLERTR